MNNKDYEKFKEQLKEDGLVIVGGKTRQAYSRWYFTDARNYFEKYVVETGRLTIWGPFWENARRTVCARYGCNYITDLPESKREEANELLMEIIDLCFDD